MAALSSKSKEMGVNDMKRLFFLALCLALLLSGVAYADVVYDFEDGQNPGFVQSGSCALEVSTEKANAGTYALKIGRRAQNDYDAADLSYAALKIEAGDVVQLSFYAYHKGDTAGEIGVGYAGGTYETVISASVAPATWTRVSGAFIMGESPQNLRFKTGDTLVGCDYFIDDLSITVGDDGTAERAADYTLDMESGIDAFVQSGTCTLSASGAQAHGGSHSLLVGQRSTNNWDAADLKVALTPIEAETPVLLRCWVYTDTADVGEVSVGEGGGAYAMYVSQQVEGRTWTQLECEFTMETLQNIRFLTTSENLLGVNLYVDDVSITLNPGDDDVFVNYASDFSQGADGWYARSNGNATIEVEIGTLKTANRTNSWNSPGRDFAFTAGKSYQLGTYVMQDELDNVNFKISVAHTSGGVESYENLGEATAKKGEWTYISGAYQAGLYDSYTLYVETDDAPEVSFAIKDFTAKKNVITYLGDIPSLKEAYADYFDLGTAANKGEASNEERMDFYASQFNIITHGNDLKPDSVLDLAASRELAKLDDTAVAVHFTDATPLLDYCQANGIKVHGHVLVWHSQTPEAFFHAGYDEHAPYVSREVMLARMESYIEQVLTITEQSYPGLIVSWDVVNEAIEDSDGQLRQSNWTKVVGDDFVLKAFEYARKYAAAGTQLYYNDYSTPYQPKLAGISTLLDTLVAEGNVDGYGFQCHYQVGSPSIEQLKTALDEIIAKGLRIRVSELDITIDDRSERALRAQAERYAALFDVFKQYADAIDAVQVWGVTDDLSWKSSKYPLLFDEKVQPKLAFWALTDPSQIPAATEVCDAYGPATADDFAAASAYDVDNFSFKALFTAEERLLVEVNVIDATDDKSDSVYIFADGIGKTIKRSSKKNVELFDGGYTVRFDLPLIDKSVGDSIDFDLMVKDADSINGWSDKLATSSIRNMGKLTLQKKRPLATAHYGNPADGWAAASPFAVDLATSGDATEGGTVNVLGRAMWDEASLYIRVDVIDPHLDDTAVNAYEQDSVEIFLDENNDRADAYGTDDVHHRVNYNGILTSDAGALAPTATAEITAGGFTALMTIPFTADVQVGQIMGFDLRYNNAARDGSRLLLNFSDDTDSGWSTTAVFGSIVLVE